MFHVSIKEQTIIDTEIYSLTETTINQYNKVRNKIKRLCLTNVAQNTIHDYQSHPKIETQHPRNDRLLPGRPVALFLH